MASAVGTMRPREIDRGRSILAMLLVATVTEAMLLLLPVYVGAISDRASFSQSQVGLLGSADLAGIAASTLSAAWWLRRVRWRETVLALIAAFFIANLASVWIESFQPLFGLRVLAGAAAGAAYAIALAGLCDTVRNDRNAALMVCGQVLFGAAGSFILPLVGSNWQIDAVFAYMNVWVAAALVVAFFAFPTEPGLHRDAAGFRWRSLAARGPAVVLGTAAYFLTIGMVWAYLERVARAAGMSSQEVAVSLGVGYLISLSGSLAAAWLGCRLGRALPMLVAGSAQIAMLVLFANLERFDDVARAFLVINIVFQFFWSYIIAYQIVIYSDADRSGRFVATYGTSMHLALAFGPYAGSKLVAGTDYTPVLDAGVVTLALCYGCFLLAVYQNRKGRLAAASAGPSIQ